MSTFQALVTIAMMVLGTAITRFLPFILFHKAEDTPKAVRYLGTVLPCAACGMLVVYCLRTVTVTVSPFGLPEAVGVLCTSLLHVWRKNTLVSIGGGTAVYMLLSNLVFT